MKKIFNKLVISTLVALAFIITYKAVDTSAATQYHTVMFVYGSNTDIQTVKHGKDAVPPTNTYVPGYTFTGWTGNYKNVTEDRMIAGNYVPGEYNNHKHYNYKVTVLFSDSVTGMPFDYKTVTIGDKAWVDAPSHKGWKFMYYTTEDGSIYNGYPTEDLNVYANYYYVGDEREAKKREKEEQEYYRRLYEYQKKLYEQEQKEEKEQQKYERELAEWEKNQYRKAWEQEQKDEKKEKEYELEYLRKLREAEEKEEKEWKKYEKEYEKYGWLWDLYGDED